MLFRSAFVAGPVVVHTGGSQYFCDLIRNGYVDVLLSGNALAVHDIEVALSGTSLGIDLSSGHPVEHGHRNHMRAINAVRRAGGIGKAVDAGILCSGHYHHLNVRAQSNRVLFIAPSLTQVGDWWANATGMRTDPGTLAFCVDPQGWSALEILR